MDSFEKKPKDPDTFVSDAISKNSELRATMQSLNNRFVDFGVFEKFVDVWNKSHPKFTQEDLEHSSIKTYCGKQDAVITIWAVNGKVRMMASYDNTADINKNPESAEKMITKYSMPNF